MKRRKKRASAAPIYTFGIVWILMSLIFPLYRLGALIWTAGVSFLSFYIAFKIAAKKRSKTEEEQKAQETAQEAEDPPRKSYGPEVDSVVQEGNRALSELGRLYMSSNDPEIRKKINELMRITDKIVQDAVADPSDVPQIKKFMNYYLPTTLKLLNSYDRMSSMGIEGENLDKSMKSINEMLDSSIDAFKKHLDSLFADQALDIETEIDVMNKLLARDGLTGQKDFDLRQAQK